MIKTELHRYRPAFAPLVVANGIAVGCSSHVLSHNGNEGSLHALREYAKSFPTIEFTTPLPQLPDLAFVRTVQSIHGLYSIWRVTICDLESEKLYFQKEPWFHFARALESNSTHNALIVALERASEYNAAQMDVLLALRESLFPLTCHFEFEHHTWSHAESLIKSAKASVVQHDAPELPGIIKEMSVPGNRAVLRLLGRNKRTWFEHHAKERFEYQYSGQELSSIAKRIRSLREESDSVTIIVATHPGSPALETARSLATIINK